MGEALEGRLAALCRALEDLPLEHEDKALIRKIVLGRLGRMHGQEKPQTPSLNKLARDIFRVSHQRNEALGESCCPDPEWNMLLELTIAHTEARPVYVSSLCVASGVPTTTALRHIERMAATGLIRRRECKNDKRRIWVEPTPHALTATEGLLRKVYEAGGH